MRRPVLATLTAAALLAGTATAAAAWVSARGGGDGEAKVINASAVAPVTVTGTPADDLTPGEPAAFDGTFKNPNRFRVIVHHIRISYDRVQGANGPCGEGDFRLEDAYNTGGWVLEPGTPGDPGLTPWEGGRVTLINDETHPGAGCLDATLKVTFTIAP